ncbi:MAG: aminotransferase class I/II-fold pyridoxal phosphate-dependent enzyme [Bacteroidia bacterium]
MPFPEKLNTLLTNRIRLGTYRQLKTVNGLVDFCSNDYLGFSKSAGMEKTSAALLSSEGTGSTGSRLISGNTVYAEELEKKIAQYHNSPAALLFNSGYTANLGLLSSAPQKNDLILFDELSHASIFDGIRLSFAKHYKFRHNDVSHLKELIARHESGVENIYIVVESVYSMDGDRAPLRELGALLSDKRFLIVDEAHATGVFGNKGKGCCEEEEIETKCFARVVTFGKALGAHGAAILGSEALRNYLINFSRSFIYTTALPYENLKNIDAAYQLLSATDQQAHLHNKIKLFRNLCSGAVNLLPSHSPIQCFLIEGNAEVEKKSVLAQDSGFDIRPIKSPTVAEGEERIRICIHSFNSDEEIKKLVETLINCNIMKF